MGRALLTLFSRSDIDIISPYRTSRDLIASAIPLFMEVVPTEVDISPLLAKIAAGYFLSDQAQSTNEAVKSRVRNTALTVCHIIEWCFKVTSGMPPPSPALTRYSVRHMVHHRKQPTGYRSARIMPELLKIILDGCSHSEIEVANACHSTCALVGQYVQVFDRSLHSDPLVPLMQTLSAYVGSVSWYAS